jgi:hypothetical protein
MGCKAQSRAARRRPSRARGRRRCLRRPSAGTGDVARALRQAADHKHQAFGADRGRFVEGALVVVDRGLAARGVSRREKAAAAQARDAHAVILDHARGFLHADFLHLIAPGIDRRNAVARAGFDRLAQVPLLAHGRQIDGEAVGTHALLL